MPQTLTPVPAQPRPGSYSLDPAWYAERERLGSLTRIYDPGTMRLAGELGLAAGWRCAEVGAGTGSIAEALAARVGGAGRVLAVDTDVRFLEPLAGGALEVRRQDVTTEPLPAGAFDLVHARLLLEHLPDRDRVLRELADALAPGGVLLVEDLDWATATVLDPPSALHARVARACRQVMEAHGYDASYGRRLPRALRAAGLVEVGTAAAALQVDADPAAGIPQWELLIEQLAPAMLARHLVTPGELQAFAELLHDGDTAVFAPLMVSSWGRRPAAAA